MKQINKALRFVYGILQRPARPSCSGVLRRVIIATAIGGGVGALVGGAGAIYSGALEMTPVWVISAAIVGAGIAAAVILKELHEDIQIERMISAAERAARQRKTPH